MMHIVWNIIVIGVPTLIVSAITFSTIIHPRIRTRRLTDELTKLLPTFNWKVKSDSNDSDYVKVLFDTVQFYFELRAGLAENGIYAYNEIAVYGIGTSNSVFFTKGQNVFKAWVEYKKFLALCKDNGVAVVVDKNFETDYKDFKKQVESLNNLKVLETSAGDK